MEKEELVVDGYGFSDLQEAACARKEKETIAYIVANSNMEDGKSLLKIYNRAVEKMSFKTIIGYRFLGGIRAKILQMGVVKPEALLPIPMASSGAAVEEDAVIPEVDMAIRKKEQDAAVREKTTIYRIIIGFLVAIIVAMIVITVKSRYSVFTYFTDYEQDIRDEVEDQYAQWQEELEQREKALEQN